MKAGMPDIFLRKSTNYYSAVPMRMALDDRKRKILQAIVDDYIETAEPVASKALASRHDFQIRSATIRNEMADLEEMGYLEQPHTSAGRIPSDKGYREYVDTLMAVENLDPREEKELFSRLETSFDEMTGLLKEASSAIAEQTGYTAITLTPKLKKSFLKQLKMMMIEPGKVLVVVVLSVGVVRDRLIRISDYLTPSQLMEISNIVEAGLCGKSLDEITLVTVTAAARETNIEESLLNQLLYEAYVSIKQADNLEVYMDGEHHMLDFPEFHDIRRAKNVFDALAKNGMIAGYLYELAEEEEIPSYMIRIGQEITLEGLDGCSFVTTTYNAGGQLTGHIGVIGPKRMDYRRVISQIGFVRMTIDRHMREIKD